MLSMYCPKKSNVVNQYARTEAQTTLLGVAHAIIMSVLLPRGVTATNKIGGMTI